LGSVIAKAVTEEYPDPIRQVAVMYTFGESGDAELLLVKYGLTARKSSKDACGHQTKQLYHERT
jgi:transketolase C-terminal domain/subunit